MNMKKTVIACTLLTGVFATASSFAGDTPAASTDSPTAHQRQTWGVGIGAALGAAAAGPLGLVAGSAIGAIIGWNEGLQTDLDETRVALAESRTALAQAQLESETSKLAAAHGGGNFTVAYNGTAQLPPEQELAGKVAKALAEGVNLSMNFRSGSDALEPHYAAQLHRLASLMTALPSLHVRLEGHADPRGTDTENLALSERRVQAVRTALIADGVEDDRITSSAFGERKPLSGQGDAESYSFDRCVVLSLEYEQLDRRATAPSYLGADAAPAVLTAGVK